MTSAQWNQMATKGTQNANDNDPYEGLFDNDTAIEKAVRKRIIRLRFEKLFISQKTKI